MPRPILLASIILTCVGATARAQSPADTMPVRVVERAIEAFKRKDLDATFADYDTTFTYEILGDGKGQRRVRRADWVRQMKSDTSVVEFMNTWSITKIERGSRGPWVFDIWTVRGPNGETMKHVDLFEVRNGKIVREIEG
ncbi:MAG TPA: nuclear transport factor 2 family protein [Gemmatimonadaceae bacterium]|nr:nuclear transport factor 2 family protein [Gemmatimonadaceae bacterium]